MGIYYSGEMLVEISGSRFNQEDIPEEFDGSLGEWLVEANEMESYREYYDAD